MKFFDKREGRSEIPAGAAPDEKRYSSKVNFCPETYKFAFASSILS
jgi:hypothetical protein